MTHPIGCIYGTRMGVTDVQATIRRIIDAVLRASGRRRRWLAQQAGIPWPDFRKRMRGDADFTTTELFAIARALDVPTALFIPPAPPERNPPRG